MYTDYIEKENDEDYYDDDDNNKFDKEKIKRLAFIVIGFIVVVIIFVVMAKACTKSTKPSDSIITKKPVVQIKSKLPLEEKESAYLTALVLYINEEDYKVNYYSDDTSIAIVDKDSGKVTGVSEGTTTIYAEYERDGEKYVGQCIVTVDKKEEQIINIESISFVTEELSLQVGKNIMLEINVSPEGAKTGELSYKSSNTRVAEVDDEGIVDAISVGVTTITVKDKNSNLSATMTVNVTEKETEIKPVDLVIYGLNEGLVVGKTAKILTEVKPDSASNSKLIWTSSNPNIAEVDENGNVTGVSPGKCTIKVSTENGISKICEVIVEANNIPVTSIELNSAESISLEVGGRKKLEYTISPSNATNKNVEFISGDSDKLYIDSNGIMYALKEGLVLVTLKTEDGGKMAYTFVDIKNNEEIVTPTNPETPTNSDDPGGSGNSQGSGSSSSCSADSIIIEGYAGTSSTKGKVYNTNDFTKAKNNKFTGNKAGMKVTTFDSCIKNVKYKLEKGTTESNLTTSVSSATFASKVGDIIYFNKGNGYYKYTITITDNNNNTYKKYYYAYLDGSSTNTTGSTNASSGAINISVLSKSADVTSAKCKFKITSSIGGLEYYFGSSNDKQTCLRNVKSTTVKQNANQREFTNSFGDTRYYCFQGTTRLFNPVVCTLKRNTILGGYYATCTCEKS